MNATPEQTAAKLRDMALQLLRQESNLRYAGGAPHAVVRVKQPGVLTRAMLDACEHLEHLRWRSLDREPPADAAMIVIGRRKPEGHWALSLGYRTAGRRLIDMATGEAAPHTHWRPMGPPPA